MRSTERTAEYVGGSASSSIISATVASPPRWTMSMTCRSQRGESDYFIGAYLLNLVAVEILFALVLAAIIIATYPNTPWALVQWGGLALMLSGAVLCYPFAKAIWLAADLIFRPVTPEEMAWHKRDGTMDDPG